MASPNPFSGQEYQVGYLSFDDNPNTEVESFDIEVTDGGEDVKTLMRGYAGRVKGAAMASLNFTGSIPYAPSDTPGVGLSTTGMITGGNGQNGAVPLDQTMLTNYNQNNDLPVKFTVNLGSPAVQQLVFKGNITNMRYAVAVGNVFKFSGTATGTFNIWANS
jgi:hypothetical protein